jgi:shikimate kinase
MRPVALVGIMGAGKTAVGRRLAMRLGRPFVDMDALLAGDSGMSVPAMFRDLGEAEFRRRESALLAQLALRTDGPVVATGGGVVLAAANRARLTASFDTFWLDVGVERAWARLGNAAGRPLLETGPGGSPRGRLERLARERRALYAASGTRVATGAATPVALAERLARRLSGSPATPTRPGREAAR